MKEVLMLATELHGKKISWLVKGQDGGLIVGTRPSHIATYEKAKEKS